MIVRRIALLLLSLGLSFGVLEVGTRILHRISHGDAFPTEALRERLAPAGDRDLVLAAPGPDFERTPDRVGYVANKVLHPYLGFVRDRDVAINRFGFYGIDPLEPRSPDEVRVVIAGGSVAMQVYHDGGDALKQHLAPAFPGKRIRLVSLGLGGYKQPQQLMALAWLEALGADFDAVVNIDGFNEVSLGRSNVALGIHPAYPRSWELYEQRAVDAPELEYMAETRRLQRDRAAWRRWLGTGLASHSAFALQLLDRIDAHLAQRIADEEAAFRARLNEAELGFQVTGPFQPYETQAALTADMVEIWKRSSLEMHALATVSGARYFHFLQPNQWLPGSKPLSEIERSQQQLQVREDYAETIAQGYPALIRAGAELKQRGVAFTSLASLFEDDPRTVYKDSCCHFNALGVERIAAAIGDSVAASPR